MCRWFYIQGGHMGGGGGGGGLRDIIDYKTVASLNYIWVVGRVIPGGVGVQGQFDFFLPGGRQGQNKFVQKSVWGGGGVSRQIN